jgi:hypothetical protein
MGKDDLGIHPVGRLRQIEVVKIYGQIDALAEVPGRGPSYGLFYSFFYVHLKPSVVSDCSGLLRCLKRD